MVISLIIPYLAISLFIISFVLDLGMQINQAMFTVNGRCGYVLKSGRLRNVDMIDSVSTTFSQTLIIEVCFLIHFIISII